MSCDPRHGSFEAAGVTLLAAAVGDSCAAPTDPPSTPSGYCYTGLASSLNQSAVHPAGPLATCAAGFQCVPTSAASCASGECVPCSFGQYCPGHTSSPCGGLNHNICPAGRSCASPEESEECAAGRYCAAGTFDGGKACPNIAYGRADLHDTSTYGFTIFCPNGSWAPAICSAGYICHNSSYREVCPAGYKCPEGANATQRCLADGFGSRSPESRCPAGSSAEGSKFDLVVVPVVLLVLAWAIGHIAKLVVRLRRQRRRPVLPTKVKGLQLGQLSDGKNLLAEVVSGAIELQQRIRKAQRSRRLTPFVKQLRSASTAELIATRMRQTSSFERYSANDPPRHASLEASLSAQQRQLSRETSSVTSLDRGAHVRRLKFALRRTLARARTETSRGENFVSLQLSDVSFTIGKSCILSGLNADMEQGDLCALMGESGSGKTTLLNAISGRATYGQLSGDITLNGKPLVRGPNMGFVPQAYLVQKTLTVFENLWYSSMLRLPGISKDDRRSIVESVLTLLGLTACAHFSCDRENSKKKLSGGQLRRVGIGSELVTRPSILLLDEPTSALDAVNTRLVVDVLKNLCKRYGILIIASLHQPRFSVVNALDKVMVLRRGEFIYAGRQNDALGYFATHGFAPQPGENPADFYIEVAFGLATSTSKPPIEAEELAAHWNRRVKADRQAQLAARRSGKCSQVEFVAWCQVAKPTVGSDVRLELWQPTIAAASEETGACEVFSLCFSNDGRSLAAATNDGAVRTYGVADGVLQHVLGKPSPDAMGVTDVEFRPNTTGTPLLACTSAAGVLTHYNTRTGAAVRSTRVAPHTVAGDTTPVAGKLTCLTCCAYRPDGLSLAFAGYDKAVRVMDEESGEIIRTFAAGPFGAGPPGHSSRVFGVTWDNSVWAGGYKSNILVSGGWDKTVRVWDMRAPEREACVRALFGPSIHGDGLSAAGGLLLTASYRPTNREALELWDLGTGKRIHAVDWPPSGRDKAHSTLMAGTFSPSEPGHLPRFCAAGGGVGANEARLFALGGSSTAAAGTSSDEPLKPISAREDSVATDPLFAPASTVTRHVGTVAGVPGGIFSIAFSGNDTLACAGADGAIRVFSIVGHASSGSSDLPTPSEDALELFGPGEGMMEPAKSPPTPAEPARAVTPDDPDDAEDRVDAIVASAVREHPRRPEASSTHRVAAAGGGGGGEGSTDDVPDEVVSGSGLRAAKALAAARRADDRVPLPTTSVSFGGAPEEAKTFE